MIGSTRSCLSGRHGSDIIWKKMYSVLILTMQARRRKKQLHTNEMFSFYIRWLCLLDIKIEVNVSSNDNILTIDFCCMLLWGALYLFNHVYVQYVSINIDFAFSYLIVGCWGDFWVNLAHMFVVLRGRVCFVDQKIFVVNLDWLEKFFCMTLLYGIEYDIRATICGCITSKNLISTFQIFQAFPTKNEIFIKTTSVHEKIHI